MIEGLEIKKRCADCGKGNPEVDFSSSRKYICKGCVRKRNQKYSLDSGLTPKFIPIVTDTHKQCGMCFEIKELKEYTNTPRGRKGKACYCKPCMSLYQITKFSKEERRIKTQNYRNNNRE